MKADGLAVFRTVVGAKSRDCRKTRVFPKIDSRSVTRAALSNYEIVNGWQKTTECRKYSWVWSRKSGHAGCKCNAGERTGGGCFRSSIGDQSLLRSKPLNERNGLFSTVENFCSAGEPVVGGWPTPLLQLRVLCLGLLQDGNVGVSVFPEGEEIFVGSKRTSAGGVGIRSL